MMMIMIMIAIIDNYGAAGPLRQLRICCEQMIDNVLLLCVHIL